MNSTPTAITAVREYVIQLFRERLPAHFIFHNVEHTAAVADMAVTLGKGCGLTAEDLEVVEIAAWFHDTGYIKEYEGHEQVSIRLAEKFLEQYIYSVEQTNKIAGCIRATIMPQSPQNLLEQVLCDADLSNLGGNDFLRQSLALKQEKEHHFQVSISDKDWYLSTLTFCQRHTFHTKAAQSLFNERLQGNIALLQDCLINLPDTSEQ